VPPPENVGTHVRSAVIVATPPGQSADQLTTEPGESGAALNPIAMPAGRSTTHAEPCVPQTMPAETTVPPDGGTTVSR
jgi:hypothetical protein